MKEEEAKTKWCPKRGQIKEIKLNTMSNLAIALRTSESIVDDIREVRDDDMQKCITSDCMMWVEESIHKDGDINNEMVVFSGHCGLINK